MGKSPILWAELKAYNDLTGGNLTSWQCKQVIAMSRAYCNMSHIASEERQIKPPYNPVDILTDEHIYNRGLHASKQADQALDINNY